MQDQNQNTTNQPAGIDDTDADAFAVLGLLLIVFFSISFYLSH